MASMMVNADAGLSRNMRRRVSQLHMVDLHNMGCEWDEKVSICVVERRWDLVGGATEKAISDPAVPIQF